MSNEHLRLAICTDGIYPHAVGGMQKHSKLLVEYLARLNQFEITVYHPHEVPVFDSSLKVREVSIPGIDENKNYLKQCYAYSSRIMGLVAVEDYDVVYSQGLAIWSGIEEVQDKLIINPHGLEPFQGISVRDRLVGAPFRRIFKNLFSQAAVTISLGGKLSDILLPMVERKGNMLAVLPNAIELSQQNTTRIWNEEVTRVLFVGRFSANKGIQFLLRAMRDLERQGPGNKLQLDLVGTGPLFEKLKTTNPSSNVIFHGRVSDEDLTILYQKAHILALPTLFEGMPTVVLEAMADGLPILVSDTGATSEQVNETNGYLLKPGDAAAIAKALSEFLQLPPSQRKEMGEHSRALVESRFTWPSVAKKYASLIEQVAAGTDQED